MHIAQRGPSTGKERNRVRKARPPRDGERGGALLFAVICLLMLMIVTVSFTSIDWHAARDIRRHTQSGQDLWSARGGEAIIETGVRVDVVTAYEKEIAIARMVPGTSNLPAFDPPSVTMSMPIYDPTSWKISYPTGLPPGAPVPTGHQLVNSGSGRTSLLGNLATWCNTHIVVPGQYAALMGFDGTQVKVAELEEAFRQPPSGPGTEPAYVLRFAVDAHVGYGRDRNDGTIELGPAADLCFPPTITSFSSNLTSVLPGEKVTLSWAIAHVTTATLSFGNSSFSVPATGTYTDTPSSTTTYTIAATSPCGNVSRTLTVNVSGTGSGGGGSPPPSQFWCDTTQNGTLTQLSYFVAIPGPSGLTVTGGVDLTAPQGWPCWPPSSVQIESPPPGRPTTGYAGMSLIINGQWTAFGDDKFPFNVGNLQVNPDTQTIHFDLTLGYVLPPDTNLGNVMSYFAGVTFATNSDCSFTQFVGASPATAACK